MHRLHHAAHDIPGEPPREARGEYDHPSYLDWLAEYLYRPDAYPGNTLDFDHARLAVHGIETKVAFVIWETAFDDSPPDHCTPPAGAMHSDFLYREALCRVLSRVPAHGDRVQLLDRFYCRLNADTHT